MLKRLIEVSLPLKEASERSAREKSIRHGHISALRICWERRPLAGCRSGAGDTAVTPNESVKAGRFSKDYWLYVVLNRKTKPEFYMVQDPARKLNPREEMSVVRYVVGQKDWSQAAGRE